ncbi:MAG: hypothetical protein IJM28_06310 [Lachnospiraceae bacterium]|nr:hypothetical protein [Lachnospiraceae bacterium]
MNKREFVIAGLMFLIACGLFLFICKPWEKSEKEKPVTSVSEVEAPREAYENMQVFSLDALSDMAGFSVDELEGVPFEVTEKRYNCIYDNDAGYKIAEITYYGEDNSLCFAKGSGTESIPWYILYDNEVETENVSGIEVKLKQDESGYSTAQWMKDGFIYSVEIDPVVEKEVILELVGGIK